MDLEKEVVKFGREDCGICRNSNPAHLTNTPIFLFSFSDVDNRFSKCLFAAPRRSAFVYLYITIITKFRRSYLTQFSLNNWMLVNHTHLILS